MDRPPSADADPTMAKKKTTSRRPTTASAKGKHLVIVESPAKARTINRYLGDAYVVEASVGHVRDLPAKAEKGTKQPVPGVDLENGFEPTYVVSDDKKSTVTALKRLAKQADDVWFATDLDREGEAIAWHLAEILGVPATEAKRVVFNAITKSEIERAFAEPRGLDLDRINAQQARRILDRIVGYQASPLLWKKVARGLSAGRVQSVALRLVVEREREIKAFVPGESWDGSVRLTADAAAAAGLAEAFATFLERRDGKGKGPSKAAQNEWMGERSCLLATVEQVNGAPFRIRAEAEDGRDLSAEVRAAAEAVGIAAPELVTETNEDGKGRAARRTVLEGGVEEGVRYRVSSIEQKRTTSRPRAPFITSSLQRAASTELGFGLSRTMRAAQRLYEGVNIPGEGEVGLITYMRTDSTHLSGEALSSVRSYIGREFGDAYLPGKPNFYGSANKDAQEAHEAIRPTDVARHPARVGRHLGDDERRLYDLIWKNFVSCQMTPAQWDNTTVRFTRSDRDTGTVLKAGGRVLAFDGWLKVAGVPTRSDEQVLPALADGDEYAPFRVDLAQRFDSPPSRYTEASLIKKLEEEGIGRPSTYASIIETIQNRGYVEGINKSLHATDVGEVVTDKLMEAFPRLMDLGYTREMEAELDEVAERKRDWKEMLAEFYGPFRSALEEALESMTHARAELEPARWACPKCGKRTAYRLGRNGRFLTCSGYPDCDFACPIDRAGNPVLEERVRIADPLTGEPMVLRTGRFGKFIAPAVDPGKDAPKVIFNLDKKGGLKYPSQPPVVTDLPCPKCEAPLNARRGKRGPWLGCSKFPKCRGRGAWAKLDEAEQARIERQLEENDREHPQVVAKDLDGRVIFEGTPLADLMMAVERAELPVHPDAVAEERGDRAA